MNRHSIIFTGPRQLAVREGLVPHPEPDQVLVEARVSAISAGTEMLIYRGLAPVDLPADPVLPALSGSLAYPLSYGYAIVGQVVEAGRGVDAGWVGQRVFAFHPHDSLFIARPDDLLRLPASLSDDDAVFLPNLETALSLVHDGRPLAGERAAVVGQGIVGLLTTALLADFPLDRLVTVDRYARRRQASVDLGAHLCLDPAMGVPHEVDATEDLTFELSGVTEGLDLAISLTGFSGRIVIGSWYGNKPSALDLGGRFHRSRIRLIASQVSTIDPTLSGRWTKARRFEFAINQLHSLRPSRLITHRFPLDQAEAAYRLLDTQPEAALQVVFDYTPRSVEGRLREAAGGIHA